VKALTFSPAAQTDIEAIWDYTADICGPDQADRYTDDICDVSHALAVGTKQGRPVDVRPGYLKFAAGSHMVYFRDHGDRIEIVRVLHNRQDTQRHL